PAPHWRHKRRLQRLCAKTRKSHKESGGPGPPAPVREMEWFTRAQKRCAGAQPDASEHPGPKARGADEGPHLFKAGRRNLPLAMQSATRLTSIEPRTSGQSHTSFCVISLVGATVGIVYGRAGATHAPRLRRRASGSVRSRTYILM